MKTVKDIIELIDEKTYIVLDHYIESIEPYTENNDLFIRIRYSV